MIKIISDMLVLKNVNMETNKLNKSYTINLSFKNLDGKSISQSFEYHNYNEAVNDFIILANSIKNK